MSDENNIPLRQEMFCSPLSVLSRFCHNSPQKRLRNFLRGDIMRKLWGRGSGGRAMRSQRIGQGFESPRLHQKTARTSCLCSFLLSRGDSAAHSLRRPALRAEPLLPVRADALLRPTRLRAQIKWRKTAIPSLRSLRVPSSPPKNAAKTQCLCRVFFVAPYRGANLRASVHFCYDDCTGAISLFTSIVRRFGGLRSKTLSP